MVPSEIPLDSARPATGLQAITLEMGIRTTVVNALVWWRRGIHFEQDCCSRCVHMFRPTDAHFEAIKSVLSR